MPNRHTGAGRQQATATQAPAGTRQPPHRRRQAAGSRHTGAGRQQAAATQAPAGTRQPPAENRRTYMYVIFDMDGVIVDSEAVYLAGYLHAAELYDLPIEDMRGLFQQHC